MGLFDSNSSSSSTSISQGAREQGRNYYGGNLNVADNGGISGRADVLFGQAAKIGNTAGNAKVTVTTADPLVAQNAIAAMSRAATDSMSAASSNLNSALGTMAGLVDTNQTGGASVAASTIKTILLGGLVIIGLAVVAIAFFRRKG